MGLFRKATPDELANEGVNKGVNRSPAGVNAGVNAQAAGVDRPAQSDRHKPGYMAEYMRKRRAKAK